VRRRTVQEMIRDSRAGAILIAKLIALGVAGIIQVLTWPLERIFAPVLNFVALHGFQSDIAPFVEFEGKWNYLFLTESAVLLVSAFWLGMAYLFAAWVYKPSPRQWPS
jgi:hypothetical protein